MKHTYLRAAAGSLLVSALLAPAFAFASDGAASMAENNKTVDTACMATAVSTRDTAISAALGTVVAAIQTRGTALSNAWKLTDATARKAAIKAANDAFKGTWKTFNKTRMTAWNTYRTSAKACRASTADVGAPTADTGSM